MSTTARDAAGIRVSDIVAPDLVVKGPYGTGEEMTLRAPWDGAELARVPTATLEDMDRVLDRARVAAEAYRWTPGVEARRDPRARVPSHRGERRADRAHHRGRGRQAAQGRARRGQARRQHLPLGGRGGQAHGRRPHRDGRRPERRGPVRLDHPRAARRDRRHLAVQLPAQPGGAQGRAGAGRRQRRRPQAGLEHPAHSAAAGGAAGRGRPPRRHAPGRRRLRPDDRQQDGHRRAHQHGELHRQPAGGPADRQRRRHEDDHPGARQQLGDHRRRGRQPRPRPAAGRGRRVRQLRPDLHLGAARRRAPGRVRRGSWRSSSPR